MDKQATLEKKIERPHAFFDEPHQVVTDPALSKAQKLKVLNSLEQDSRQLAAASDEGMTGGETGKLHDVLEAKDTLALPPIAQAYDLVLKDLRLALDGDAKGETRTLMELALTALGAVVEAASAAVATAHGYSGLPKAQTARNGVPAPGSPAEIEDEIAREKLDP
jgi:hypothetical protein